VLRRSEPRRQVGQAALPHEAAKPPDEGGRHADHYARRRAGLCAFRARAEAGSVSRLCGHRDSAPSSTHRLAPLTQPFCALRVIAENDRAAQRKIIKFNHLLADCLLFSTVALMSHELVALREEGYPIDADAVASMAPGMLLAVVPWHLPCA